MYSLLALCCAGLWTSAVDAAEGRKRGLRLSLWTAVGLHAHYFFPYYLLPVGCFLTWHASQGARTRSARRALLGLLAGCALAVPWLLYGFRAQMESGKLPGRSHVGLSLYAQSLSHLLFVNSGLGGWLTRGAAVAGSCAALGLTIRGARRLYHGDRRLLLLAALLTLGVPALAMAVVMVYPRAGYNWRYIAGSLGTASAVIAAGVALRGAVARTLTVVLFSSLLLVAIAGAWSPGREDLRAAVFHIAARLEPGDGVVHNLTDLRDARLAWTYYFERAPRSPAAAQVPAVRLYELSLVDHLDRLWLLVRTRPEDRVWKMFVRHHPRVTEIPMGRDATVYLLER